MAAILVISRGFVALQENDPATKVLGAALVIAAFGIGSSPVWLGSESLMAGTAAIAALIVCKALPAPQVGDGKTKTAPVINPGG
jgi:hypothetical protein